MHLWSILFLFIFTLEYRYVFTFLCTNKSIQLLGIGDKLSRTLFASLAPSYTAFRSKYDISVSMTLMTASDAGVTYNRDGIIGPPTFINQKIPITFAATPYEVPLHSNDVQFPVTAQGIAIIYNLPDVTNLNLSTVSLAKIYDGRIKYWNDAAIKEHNPNVQLPNQKILPIARSDGDATTIFFTTILSSTDTLWNQTYGIFSSASFVNNICCNSTKWPPTIFMYGNDVVGMVGLVSSIAYSIGYATLDAVDEYSIGKAGLVLPNQDLSSMVTPSVENIQQRMYSFLNNSKPESIYVEVDANFTLGAYPLTIFPYLIVNLTYDSLIDCCIVQELVGFMDWLYSAESDELLGQYGYIPIVAPFAERIKRKVIMGIRCSQGYVYSSYLASMVPTSSLQSWLIAVITAVAILLAAAGFIASYYVYYKYFYVDESRWFITLDRIKVLKEQQAGKNRAGSETKSDSKGSSISVYRTSASQNTTSQQDGLKSLKEFMIKGELDENKVYLDPLACKVPQQWSKTTKRSVIQWKNVINKNVASLFGMTMIGPQPHGVFEFCSKGTLHYVLLSSRYSLSVEIRYQFALDVAQGLKYLHYHGIVHGYLSSITCYLDSCWTVKIAHWEKMVIYQLENYHQIKMFASYKDGLVTDEVRLIEYLYVDPKILDRIHTSVDVFSFGVLLVEIFTRKLPYADLVEEGAESYSEILAKKFTRCYMVQPKLKNSLRDVLTLITKCWSIEETRPTVAQLCTHLKGMTKSSNGIVDIIMNVLERHAEALEEKVDERTAELKQVTERMRHLLHEVLPSQIAENLLSGQPVLPEHFECITVYFSDIVGFTTLSAMSSPIEVMTLLNDLWLAFDNVIEKFDVYKVDTIGDAYMVCSGLPVRNGMEHCRQIALLSLALLEKCNRFKITHLPHEQLKIRIGINSGPAIAGVVGSKMPQYCVFGDTVNTAARMESTSMPQKIQMAEVTARLTESSFPNQFEIVYRGEVDVKGKGDMKTYWLIGKKAQ